MRKLATSAIGAVAALGLAAGATVANAADDEVVVGFAASYSGWMQAYSQPSTNAALIAIDDINAKGGILGKKITYVMADAKTDRVEGAKAGQEVLNEGAQMVAVDCDYDFGAPAALAAKNANKIAIFLCAESVLAGIQGVGKNAFSSSVLAGVQGATIAEWGAQNKGWKTAYILLDTTIEYNKGICYGFDWMWREKLGLEILGHDVYQNGDASIAAQITRIKSLPTQPDIIINCSYIPGGASALRQIRAAGITSALAGGSSMSGTYWLDSVPNLTGHYVTEQASIYGDDPRPAVEEFNKKYEARFGERPNSQYTYPGYLVVEMWARAVEKAGTFDTDAVIAAMETFREEPFLIGTRTFTNILHHQDRAPYLIVETTNGKPAVAADFTISEPVPLDVLFGKRYSYIAR
ncbi:MULTISPECIES: ABC transporter substrate-binding protein [unclassified Minwuia]|jgi:branched-chain amino acid transport system substrate-binding protein|uniref:ABC transporter substrate-binding protein n=1 Tax=unclassified Minwuia TaxID=2618799 RepID=UPI00247A84AA|nr:MULTISPECIES: ABC transporter substrate-binding protein [unclassified Minwuia]